MGVRTISRSVTAGLLGIVSMAISLAAAKPVVLAPPIQPSGIGIIAYYEGSNSNASLNSLYASFNQLATDSFNIGVNGNVTGTIPTKAVTFVQSKKMVTFATVSNFGKTDFDSNLGHKVITSTANTQRFITSIALILSRGNYTGVNIDFESILPTDRAAYTTFVTTVCKQLHGLGYLVVVSAPAKLVDDPTDSWTGAFNFAALAPVIDILQLMTYDENGPWGNPGPVAGLDWTESAVRYAISVVPANKVSLGIPAYGYDWNLKTGTGNQIAWSAIEPLIASSHATPQWDASSSSPFFNYTDKKGKSHVVWYEDASSIPLKSRLVVTYGLVGASIYALGMEDASFWQAVHAGGF